MGRSGVLLNKFKNKMKTVIKNLALLLLFVGLILGISWLLPTWAMLGIIAVILLLLLIVAASGHEGDKP